MNATLNADTVIQSLVQVIIMKSKNMDRTKTVLHIEMILIGLNCMTKEPNPYIDAWWEWWS